MKRFIVKGILFLLPIIGLYAFLKVFYTTDKGDILRVGYIADSHKNYRDIFKNEFDRKVYFTLLSDLDLDKPHEFTVMTIGDSFSEQKQFGYKNYLAEKEGISLLHYDSFLHDNPIQTLSDMLNGDLLDKVNVKYIILQSVERHFAARIKDFDDDSKLTIDSVKNAIGKYIPPTETPDEAKFFSDLILKFPLYNIKYKFDDNAYDSDIYKVKTNSQLFSVPEHDMLFFFEDLINFPAHDNPELIEKLNNQLNILDKKLKARNITLIVLPCPDKSDFYYNEITNKEAYYKPAFFEQMDKKPKQYIYIDAKKVLQTKMNGRKDAYFYDDTHWSPWSAKIIADTLSGHIKPR
jgi:hypothetical protein